VRRELFIGFMLALCFSELKDGFIRFEPLGALSTTFAQSLGEI